MAIQKIVVSDYHEDAQGARLTFEVVFDNRRTVQVAGAVAADRLRGLTPRQIAQAAWDAVKADVTQRDRREALVGQEFTPS